MGNIAIGLLCFVVTVLLAIYWTVWKIRAELNQNLEKAASELSNIRKSLEKKTGNT
jgi:uncharacterized membrane protein YqjE